MSSANPIRRKVNKTQTSRPEMYALVLFITTSAEIPLVLTTTNWCKHSKSYCELLCGLDESEESLMMFSVIALTIRKSSLS